MISLAGKAALVTGGSRGIGTATVKLFAQAGADVVFGYHQNRETAGQVEQEARKHGTRIESFKADVGRMDDAKKLVEHARERLGRLDILVANAGIWNGEDAPIEKLSEREWGEMIRVNLKGVYAAVHHAVPHRMAQGGGRMVTLGSVADSAGQPSTRTTPPQRARSSGFTKGLAAELAHRNILVNCVATAEEVAGPILFAVSDLATYVTGEVINVNGGSFPCG
jgi:3-oxoacyl-[acyl-carrier protein] reductase